MSCATTVRMKYSPCPVADTAQLSLLAYVPAPMMGESPTRPQRLPVMPPVEVAAARLPCRSSATAPTVPKASSSFSRAMAPRRLRSSWRCRAGVRKYSLGTISMPCSLANSSAPAPTSMTCGDLSMTRRARSMGFFTCCRPVTAPAPNVLPSMSEASSSATPSRFRTAPRPALNKGLSSRTRTAAMTASRLDAPRPSTA